MVYRICGGLGLVCLGLSTLGIIGIPALITGILLLIGGIALLAGL